MEIDTTKLKDLSDINSGRADIIYNLVDSIVSPYSSELDEWMENLYKAVVGEDAISTDDAERYYASITNCIYFMTNKLEKLNIYSDIAKVTAKEAYSKAYIKSSAEKDEKGKSLRTVGENQSVAEMEAQYDNVNSSIYEHAYRLLKAKIDAATEAVTMLKNLIKRRMNEEYLSGLADSNKVMTSQQPDD